MKTSDAHPSSRSPLVCSRPIARLVSLLCAGALLVAGGCEEERPSRKPYKSSRTRKAKRERVEVKEKSEKVDPIDEAWNTPATEGMAKLRLALHGDKGMIKGRPSFMAPQFEMVGVEQLERIHEDGFRATDRKKSKTFNPNEHGRFIWELKPGLWKIYVNPLDDLWLPWISDVIKLNKGQVLSLDVNLRKAKKAPKY